MEDKIRTEESQAQDRADVSRAAALLDKPPGSQTALSASDPSPLSDELKGLWVFKSRHQNSEHTSPHVSSRHVTLFCGVHKESDPDQNLFCIWMWWYGRQAAFRQVNQNLPIFHYSMRRCRWSLSFSHSRRGRQFREGL